MTRHSLFRRVRKRDTLPPGEVVKLIFRMSFREDVQVERMWVIVKSRTDTGYIGTLDSDPFCTKELQAGAEVFFGQNMSFRYMKNRT